MRIATRSVLSGIVNKSTEAINALDKSDIELVQDLADATEALNDTRKICGSLMTTLDELEVAYESLETNGFSKKWLGTINVNGDFAKMVDIDFTSLIGTSTQKTHVAMEGVLSTIWEWIKKIWNFIVGLVMKVVNFIKNIFSISKRDVDNWTKLQMVLKEVGLGDKNGIVSTKLGEEINKVGSGGKMYDLRELIVRMNTAAVLASYLKRQYEKSVGKTQQQMAMSPDTDMFSDEFLDYVRSGRHSNTNKILKDVVDTINDRPAIIPAEGDFISGFNGFDINPSISVEEALKISGISFGYSGDDVVLKVDTIEKCISKIDYTSTYSSIVDYNNVLGHYIAVLKRAVLTPPSGIKNNSTLDKVAGFFNDLKQVAIEESKRIAKTKHIGLLTGMFKSSATVDEARQMEQAYLKFSRWSLETVNVATQLITIFNATSSEARRIYNVCTTNIPKFRDIVREMEDERRRH